MIDQLACLRARVVGEKLDPTYTQQDAVKGTYIVNASAPDLVVVFPPWHGGTKAISLLNRRLVRSGNAVLSFDFHDQILEADKQRVLESHQFILEHTSQHIDTTVERNDYKSVTYLGLSLGVLSLALTAKVCPKFDQATIVLGSSNLALSMWEGNRTSMIREQFETDNVTKDELDVAWSELAPKNHAEHFAGRDVRMIISDNDDVIPTVYQYELADALRDSGASLHQSYTQLGHYATIFRHFILET